MALAEFLNDLQQLERAAFGAQGPLILEAFTRHTPFDAGAVWLRESRGAAMKLAAKCGDVNVDDVLDRELPGMLVGPIRTSKENLGVVALSGEPASDDDLQMLNAAATFLGTLMNNQRLSQEAREGDFQLKYRLWELESLYDIGLSIAASFLTDDVRRQLLREGTPVTFGEGFVAVPITGAAGIIAVLVAADRESRHGSIGAFEDNELRLLSLFASQVGIAMENARLHREALEKQAMERELELAATIQRDILPKKIPDVAGV